MGKLGEEIAFEEAIPVDSSIYYPKFSSRDSRARASYRNELAHSKALLEDVFEKVKMSDIVAMYRVYHEMDIRQFYDAMDEKMSRVQMETRLKRIREAAGLYPL